MGCASSAALPFLSTKENHSVVESTSLNGKHNYELPTISPKIEGSIKDLNESFISEKIKGVVDSTAVQGVIGEVVKTKDEIYNQVKEVGDTITEKVNTVVSDVEETIGSTFNKISSAVGATEDKVKSEVKSLESDVKSLLNIKGEEIVKDTIKPEDIDELLDALPAEEVAAEEVVKSKAEEVLEKAAEEMKEELEKEEDD